MTCNFDENEVVFYIDAETMKKAKEKAEEECYDSVEDYAQHLIYKMINELCPDAQSCDELEANLRLTLDKNELSEKHIAVYCQYLKGKSLLEIEKILSIPHDEVNGLINDMRKIVNKL